MKTFNDLKVGDYIYCVDKDRKVGEILQIIDITSDISYTVFACNIIWHDILIGLYTRLVCLDEEKNCYEITRRNTYITTDENVFTKYLKQITDEDV